MHSVDYTCHACGNTDNVGAANQSVHLCSRCLRKEVDALPSFRQLRVADVKLILLDVANIAPVHRSGMSIADWIRRLNNSREDWGRLTNHLRKLTQWAGWGDYSDDRAPEDQDT